MMKPILERCLRALRPFLPSLMLALVAVPLMPVAALELPKAELEAFLAENAKRKGFDAELARRAIAEARVQQSILDAIARPAEAKPWHQYRKIFIQPERIDAGRRFIQEYAADLANAEARHGVEAAAIAAIIGVETFYGRNVGKYRVLDALATLGFRYPKRAEFFRAELAEFIALCNQQGFDPAKPVGSYAGAMGLGQFMPSSYRAYAADGDDDGTIDIWDNRTDAASSVANYLARHGWQHGAPVVVAVEPPPGWSAQATKDYKPAVTIGSLRAQGFEVPATYADGEKVSVVQLEGEAGPEVWLGFMNFYVITRYNRSPLYAMAVYQLAEALGLP
jgi:membrane-bound lytic murein transglycosylase B